MADQPRKVENAKSSLAPEKPLGEVKITGFPSDKDVQLSAQDRRAYADLYDWVKKSAQSRVVLGEPSSR